MTKNSIRARDHRRYCKDNGAVPEGMTMHHLWYSEEYNPDSFVIITKEEHEKIHGRKIDCSTGEYDAYAYTKEYTDRTKDKKSEYDKQYYDIHVEKIKNRKKEYYKENYDKIKKKNKAYYEANRERIREKQKEYHERIKHRQKLIDRGVI